MLISWLLSFLLGLWDKIPASLQDTVAAVLLAYILWDRYIVVMGLRRAHMAGRLKGLNKWLSLPVLFVALIVDVLVQFTGAIWVFRKFPHAKFTRKSVTVKGWTREIPWLEVDWLVTWRLKRYIREDPDGWRGQRAKWWCEHVLDVFDPTGSHCDD